MTFTINEIKSEPIWKLAVTNKIYNKQNNDGPMFPEIFKNN
jgi:hypothetical protein